MKMGPHFIVHGGSLISVLSMLGCVEDKLKITERSDGLPSFTTNEGNTLNKNKIWRIRK
jgi:hypothetical protein